MHVITVGMNHKTAPIEIRERLALNGGQPADFLDEVRALPSVTECAVLSTCHRLEIYAAVTRYHEALEELVDLLGARMGTSGQSLLKHLYVHHHYDAARHLFTVASGLDSLIIGEDQVLAQVRAAYQLAQEAATAGKVLHDLFQRALRLGKRVRTETSIARNSASVSSAAVELARRRLGDLSDRRVLLVGAGAMAELAAEILHRNGARLWVANRTLARGEQLAGRWDGQPVPLTALASVLPDMHMAIVSTNAPEHLLTVDLVKAATAQRVQPLLIVDISVPRNVEPTVAQLPNVELYDVDDLGAVVEDGLAQRQQEVPRVEAMIRQEIDAFGVWLEELEVAPLIRSLREMAEEVRSQEVERLFARLPELTAREREAIEVATNVIVKRILNEPTMRLRRYAAGDEADRFIDAIGALFNLPGFDKAAD